MSYAACKKVVSNPFSTATNQPKIPDGRVPLSLGSKRNLVTTINFQTANTVDIIISPRFDSPIYFASAERSTTTPTDPLVEGAPNFNDNHPFAKAWTSVTDTEIKQVGAGELSKIRLVSQGTKVTLTNSTDDNDGYFEAFRFSPQKDGSTWIMKNADATPGTPYQPQAFVEATMFGNKAETSTEEFIMNLSSKSSYVTGKLRDLHRYVWTNKPTEKNITFTDLPLHLSVGAQLEGETTAYAAPITFQDWQYDVIWIRVHGRGVDTAANGGGCCLPTRLMIHLVQNAEFVCGEENTLHSYMTKSAITKGYKYANMSSPYMRLRSGTYKKSYKRKSYKKPARRKAKGRTEVRWI